MNIRQQKIALVFLLILTNILAFFYFFMVPQMGTGIVAQGGEQAGPFKIFFSIYGSGTGSEPTFQRPYDVALDDMGNIFVTDIDANRVLVFNRFGRYQFNFGAGGMANPPGGEKANWLPGYFLYPAGIDISLDGEVFVVDSGNKRINVYDTKGNFLRYFPGNDSPVNLTLPLMIKVTSQEAFVTDKDRVVVFNHEGVMKRQIGEPGREKGRLDGADGITIDKEGNVYVADGLNMTLNAYDKEGKLKWSEGKPPASIREGMRRFGLPCGLAIDRAGNIMVADAFHHSLQVYSPAGEKLAELGGLGTENGQFSFPRGIKVGSNDSVYVADSENKRVQVLQILRFEIAEEFQP